MGRGHEDTGDAPVQNRVTHTHHIDHSIAPQDAREMQWHSFPEVFQELFHLQETTGNCAGSMIGKDKI